MKIKLKNCSVKINNDLILKDLDFEIKEELAYHISGENGAGKSVFLQAILGLVPFTDGEYEIAYNKADLCYITSIPFYFDNEKVRSVIKLLSKLYKVDLSRYEAILSQLGLSYDDIAHKKMAELSQGTRQKIVISPLFLDCSSFFVLDEIFAGIDEQTQKKLITRLCELADQKKTLIVVEHTAAYMNTLKQSIKMEELICKNQTISAV